MLHAIMGFVVVGAFLLALATIAGTMMEDGRRVLAILTGYGVRHAAPRLRAERIVIRMGRRSLRPAAATRPAWRAAA